MSDRWTMKATWMREVHASSATWTAGDDLTSLILDPLPPEADAKTQPSLTPLERERRAREERRALTMRSSGGPVMRLSEDK